MLIPRFELSQTEDELTINIHAPYANIKDTVIHIDRTDFRFYSTPYYLRLNLPGEIEENDASKGDYNFDNGDFNLKFSKVNKGEYFENLGMITTFLTPLKKNKNVIPKIEVITNPCCNNDNDINYNKSRIRNDNILQNKNQCFIEQNLIAENIQLTIQFPKYGFANRFSGSLHLFESAWIKEIIDLPLPDKTLSKDRKKLRECDEFKKFNEQHYMADFVESDDIEFYILHECEWEKMFEIEIHFNEIEKDILKELPNREYLMDENEISIVLYGMVDILFASCYNYRTTLGENTVESGWTINKLSSTLSWFQNFMNINDVMLSCIRRSLCYPLIRNWNLSIKVFQDVKTVIKLGKKYILKRFCEIYTLFNNSYEPRYILNQLYIQDYMVWLQQVPNSTLNELYLLLENMIPTKEEIGLDLTTIEEAVDIVLRENLIIENNLNMLPTNFEKLIIDNTETNSENRIFSLKNNSNNVSESDTSSSGSIIRNISNPQSLNNENFKSNKNIIHCINIDNNSKFDSDDESS